jgi:hypothetical protein
MSTGTRNQVLERRVRQLLLLQGAAKKVNSILDLEELLDEIVGGVAEAFGCNRTAVLLKNDARNDLEMIALRGFSSVHLKGYRFKVGGEGMVGHVSATSKDALCARREEGSLLCGQWVYHSFRSGHSETPHETLDKFEASEGAVPIGVLPEIKVVRNVFQYGAAHVQNVHGSLRSVEHFALGSN